MVLQLLIVAVLIAMLFPKIRRWTGRQLRTGLGILAAMLFIFLLVVALGPG